MALEDEFDPTAERKRSIQSNKNSYEVWSKKVAESEGKSEAAFMKATLLLGAKNIVEKYRAKWAEAAAAKAQVMADCVKGHNSPPDNYWLPEHRAHAQYQNALNFLAAVEEA